jgi:hypothetical protein
MSVSCACFVLPGRCLCDELITRPEESYRRFALPINLKKEMAIARVGPQRQRKKGNVIDWA